MHVAGAMLQPPAHNIEKDGGQGRSSGMSRRAANFAQRCRRQLPPGHRQQQCGRQRITRHRGQPMPAGAHQPFDFGNGVAMHVVVQREDGDLLPFEQDRTQPAGQQSEIDFVQGAHERRRQAGQIVMRMQPGRRGARCSGLRKRGRVIHGRALRMPGKRYMTGRPGPGARKGYRWPAACRDPHRRHWRPSERDGPPGRATPCR